MWANRLKDILLKEEVFLYKTKGHARTKDFGSCVSQETLLVLNESNAPLKKETHV